MANLGFGPRFVERLQKGDIRKVFHIITFNLKVDSGEVVSVDDRTPSDGVFQVEYVNVLTNEPVKVQIKDTFTNRNWFSDYTYAQAFAGDGKSAGFLPSPILLNPSTQILVSATYDSNDPLSGGSDSAVGQIIIAGYILVGLMDISDIYK